MYVFLAILTFIVLWVLLFIESFAHDLFLLGLLFILLPCVFFPYILIKDIKLKDWFKRMGMFLFSPVVWRARIAFGASYKTESDNPEVKEYIALCDSIKAKKEEYKKLQGLVKKEKAKQKVKEEKEAEKIEKEIENAQYVDVVNMPYFEKRPSFFFTRLLSFILVVAIIAGGMLFFQKKTYFDYKGTYAYSTLTYSDVYGLTVLISYKPEYQTGDAEGFAITHIDLYQIDQFSRDAYEPPANSRDLTGAYTLLGSLFKMGDWPEWVLKLADLNLKAKNVGNNGKYFVIDCDTFEDYYR